MDESAPQFLEIQLTTINKLASHPPVIDEERPAVEPIEEEGIQPPADMPPPKRLKSQARVIVIGLIVSLSAINLGYSLKQITSVPIETIVTEYSVTINSFAALSILIGIMPIGAIVGVLISVQMMKKFRRVKGLYLCAFINVGAAVLINITVFPALIAGRFVEGICIGFYAGVAPIYLREIAPKELRRMLGLFFSLGKIIGVIFVIVLEIVLREANVTIAYRIILSFTAVFGVIQAILLLFFGSNTPTEMMEHGQREEAREIIKILYLEDHVEDVYNQYVQECDAACQTAQDKKDDKNVVQAKQNTQEDLFQSFKTPQKDKKNKKQIKLQINQQVQSNNKLQNISEYDKPSNLTFQQQKSMLYCLGVHMCALRQFCGGNVLLIQGGLFIKTLDQNLGTWTPLIINLIQFAAIIFGIVYLQKKLGKKPIFTFSLATMSALNFALVIGMIYQNILAVMIIMSIFMAVFGGAFINQNWAYPSQVIPARESTVPNIVHWMTLSISNLVPPLVSGAMPNNNPFPVFIFFGVYCFIGFVHVRSKLQQTDGFTYLQIVKSMK